MNPSEAPPQIAPSMEHGSSRRASVEVVDHVSGFERLRRQWNELLCDSSANSPFLTWEWLYAWWTHLRGRSRLHLLVVRVGDDVVAIAPLQVTRDLVPWFTSLEFLGGGCAGSDYLDVIVRHGFEAEAIRALADAIGSQGRTLRLNHVPSESLASRLAMQLEGQGWTSRETSDGVCPVIPLAGHTWDSYLASRGAAHRANVRRKIKAAARAFDVRFERVTSTDRRLEVLRTLATFHDGRWRGHRGSTAFRTPQLLAFHLDATGRAFDSDWLRLYALYLNDQIAGAMYAFNYDHRFYFYQHGFDDRYRAFSPGLLLMALTISAAIEEGAIEFDLLYGVESYKWLWADDRRFLSGFDLFPARLGGRLHQRGVDAESILRALVRRLRWRVSRVA